MMYFAHLCSKLGLIDPGVFSHAGVSDTHDLFASSLLKLGLIDAGVCFHTLVCPIHMICFARLRSS
jgi:hypothetical protein